MLSTFHVLVLISWLFAPLHVYRTLWSGEFHKYTRSKKRMLTCILFVPLALLFLNPEVTISSWNAQNVNSVIGICAAVLVNLLAMIAIVDTSELEI
jgi:hypothetical protein